MNSAAKFGEREVDDVFIIDDEDVVLGEFEVWEFEADGFVDAATNTIAADGGFEDFFRDDDSEALLPSCVFVID